MNSVQGPAPGPDVAASTGTVRLAASPLLKSLQSLLTLNSESKRNSKPKAKSNPNPQPSPLLSPQPQLQPPPQSLHASPDTSMMSFRVSDDMVAPPAPDPEPSLSRSGSGSYPDATAHTATAVTSPFPVLPLRSQLSIGESLPTTPESTVDIKHQMLGVAIDSMTQAFSLIASMGSGNGGGASTDDVARQFFREFSPFVERFGWNDAFVHYTAHQRECNELRIRHQLQQTAMTAMAMGQSQEEHFVASQAHSAPAAAVEMKSLPLQPQTPTHTPAQGCDQASSPVPAGPAPAPADIRITSTSTPVAAAAKLLASKTASLEADASLQLPN